MSINLTVENFIRNEILFEDTSIDLSPDRDLIGSGILDSLALLRLIVFVEESYGIVLEQEDIDVRNFQTINRINEFVKEQQSRVQKNGSIKSSL